MFTRPLSAIAADIRASWVTKSGRPCVSPYAEPYLSAMSTLSSIEDNFGYDTGVSVVLYFLSNASSFRGPDARRLKDELKAHVRSTGYRI